MNVPAHEVRIARIGKPHGIRGEVTVEVFTDSPEVRFAHGNCLRVHPRDRAADMFQTLTVERSRWNKKILLLKFLEFSDRNTAELLRDSELYAEPGDQLADDNSWYAHDLIGFSVYESTFESAAIGEVIGLITGGSQDLLEIEMENGTEVLVPFVEEIVPEIDDEQGAVLITPPPGLMELNRE